MATTTLKISKPKPVDRFCPECAAKFHDPSVTANLVICNSCAAICIYDVGKGFYRMLLTQEWLDVILLPGFYDLLEGRQAALDRITAPTPAKKKA